MGLFGSRTGDVISWQEYRDDVIFWKWPAADIKKGSRICVNTGQEALLLVNGQVEGIFEDEGMYEIGESFFPDTSFLKGMFGGREEVALEVLFVNKKEIAVRWGTKNAVQLPSDTIPGGIPVRAFGTFTCKVGDYLVLIDKIAGVRQQYTVTDVQDRVLPLVDQMLMKWMIQEGKDLLNLQANSAAIGKGIQEELDYELFKVGLRVTGFHIQNVSYPEEVQRMAARAAGQVLFARTGGGRDLSGAKYCPECGTELHGAKFCPNCGLKIK